MNAIELLKSYKKRLDPELEKYFRRKIKEAGKVDFLAREAVKIIADFTLASGKRVRPAMVYYAYLASGGRREEEIIQASMAMELVHSFLLIHDDIIDRDAKRHGTDTVHERYRQIGEKIAPEKDSRHFGNSMAIVAGDLASAMANEVIFTAPFPPKILLEALSKLQEIIYVTIPGEMLDVVMSIRGRATEEEILRMFEGKTSRYTFEGPLHLGAVLAGADKKTTDCLTRYSLPLGKAFQIQDDILGVFGEEKKLGKPVGSDVSEGKQTLLLIKALEKADRRQKEIIRNCLGKADLGREDLEKFRQVVVETGSLEYSRALSRKLVGESLRSLEKVNFRHAEAVEFFRTVARYIIEREQ